MSHFTAGDRLTFVRIAEAAAPAGAHIPPPDAATLDATLRIVSGFGSSGPAAYRALLRAVDLAALPLTGRRLAALPLARREAILLRLADAEATAWIARAVTAPIKLAQAQASGLERTLGAVRDERSLPVAREAHRYQQRITDGAALDRDAELEVDVVVVGTGAGGAPVAKALAARGHAVVMLEAGAYFTRADFAGAPLERQRKLYVNGGMTGTLGNTAILVPMGRSVGGTTTINSGTCYRTPSRTMRRWQLEEGLRDLGPGSLDAYFEQVERMLGVEPASAATLGGCARVIARGCEALGYAHGPLSRGAPGCDAQGTCCFGCPTDAKRSTNVSYVPDALAHGAQLTTRARVTQILVEGGRAVGVVAQVGEGISSCKLTVRARAVVLACGSVETPAMLLRQGLANRSGQVGRQLTIHPASYAYADFDEPIRGFAEIPQGYAVEEFADIGVRFEGAFVPLSLAAGSMRHTGHRFTELMERFDQLACFGFMIEERSRGRVVLGRGGRARMRYHLEAADVRRIVQAQGLLARIYFAAGARAVYPGLLGYDVLNDLEDVARLEREGPERVRARHLDLSAYHPLGTCRMGADPARSVIGPTQECWDVPGLFVCDGAAVPGPLGVNPQVTIMALSERAAQFVERRVEEGTSIRVPAPPAAAISFDETMSGMVALTRDEGGGCADVSFTVHVAGDASITKALRERGATWRLDGTIDAQGIATAKACEGSLVMRPLARRRTLVYDLAFEDDDGARCTLHGEKHAISLTPLRGMTTLHTELRREGLLVGRGVVSFNLGDLKPWLASWRLSRAGAPARAAP